MPIGPTKVQGAKGINLMPPPPPDWSVADYPQLRDDFVARPQFRTVSEYILPSAVAPRSATNIQKLWLTEGLRAKFHKVPKPILLRETHFRHDDPLYPPMKETLFASLLLFFLRKVELSFIVIKKQHIDDLLFLFASKSQARGFRDLWHVWCADHGLRLNLKKSTTEPTQTIKHIGFELDL
ncbi:hypothetical protein BG015_010881 [Linnemannia schmuckeri]|uniref:Reverse transcriptase domain-containing protein n=1 Tax=Linnemannia schmuckeri TaxID=64567 RepID=A0A9P5RWZ0_9FUNG|nr:hypothetical protein BG015_010881 [Linnemannia schmuckeri]